MIQFTEENKDLLLIVGGLFIAGMVVLIAYMDDEPKIK